jgi:uncharacterized protein YggE
MLSPAITRGAARALSLTAQGIAATVRERRIWSVEDAEAQAQRRARAAMVRAATLPRPRTGPATRPLTFAGRAGLVMAGPSLPPAPPVGP